MTISNTVSIFFTAIRANLLYLKLYQCISLLCLYIYHYYYHPCNIASTVSFSLHGLQSNICKIIIIPCPILICHLFYIQYNHDEWLNKFKTLNNAMIYSIAKKVIYLQLVYLFLINHVCYGYIRNMIHYFYLNVKFRAVIS